MKEKEITIHSLEELDKAAREFLNFCSDKNVFAFFGEMGSGKTTFIKAICRTLGVEENVSSPTFSIVNEYRTANDSLVYHFDFYRIEKIQEAVDIGVEEYFGSGHYCFIEWSEKVLNLLPKDCVFVYITVKKNERQIKFQMAEWLNG